MMYFKSRLPFKFKNKSLTRVFKIDNIEYKIEKNFSCKNCNVYNKTRASCSKCSFTKFITIYTVHECQYSKDFCPRGIWCKIHYKKNDSHGLTCTCDKCY